MNLFAYCGNNPVNRSDPTGHNWWDNVKKWASDTWNSVTTWVSDNFGTQSVTDVKSVDDEVPVLNIGILKIKKGSKTTTSVESKKSKTITAYKNNTKSGVGVKAKISSLNANANASLADGYGGSVGIEHNGANTSISYHRRLWMQTFEYSTSASVGDTTTENYLSFQIDQRYVAAGAILAVAAGAAIAAGGLAELGGVIGIYGN